MASVELQEPQDLEAPAIKRQHSTSRSVISIIDWQERQLTVQDIEDFLDLNEEDGKEEYAVIHRKLQIHLDAYNGPNPWVHVLPFTWYEVFKMVFFTLTGIILAKILIFLIILLFCYIGCVVKNCCCMQRRSSFFNLYMRGLTRLILFFVFGIYWIPVTYTGGSKLRSWPAIITPNHVSLIEAFTLYYLTGAVFVAKGELCTIPVLGSILIAMGQVFVDRSSKKARKEVINMIRDHAANPCSPPLLIFPQGTVTNTLTITQFKCGAFIPGVTVLPTAVHYGNRFCDMVLLEGLFSSSLHIMSQFINFASIEFLEPYEPSEEERQNAVFFANNVRKVLAKALNASMTPHTFDDFLLAAFADRLKKQNENKGVHMIEMAPFIMDDCHRKLKIKAKTVIELGKIYMRYCDENGRITLRTFCDVFHIRDEVMAKILFDFFINNNSHFILFDDFLAGVAICYQGEHVDDALTLFYLIVDRESQGHIKAMDVMTMAHLIQNDANRPFDTADIKQFCFKIFDAEKQLSFEEFKQSVKLHEQTKLVQAFLQFIVFEFLDIKLDQNMIVVRCE
eukprot:345709_1